MPSRPKVDNRRAHWVGPTVQGPPNEGLARSFSMPDFCDEENTKRFAFVPHHLSKLITRKKKKKTSELITPTISAESSFYQIARVTVFCREACICEEEKDYRVTNKRSRNNGKKKKSEACSHLKNYLLKFCKA